jgi:predicted DNA-binding protein
MPDTTTASQTQPEGQAGSGDGAYAVRAVRMHDALWARTTYVARLTGAPAAEVVRRALDAYLDALPGGSAGIDAELAREVQARTPKPDEGAA